MHCARAWEKGEEDLTSVWVGVELLESDHQTLQLFPGDCNPTEGLYRDFQGQGLSERLKSRVSLETLNIKRCSNSATIACCHPADKLKTVFKFVIVASATTIFRMIILFHSSRFSAHLAVQADPAAHPW